MLGTSVWWFLVYSPQSYKVYYPTEMNKTLRSAVCGPISGEHRKWLLSGHNPSLSVSIVDAQQVVIHHSPSCHLSAVRQPASFYIFITTPHVGDQKPTES